MIRGLLTLSLAIALFTSVSGQAAARGKRDTNGVPNLFSVTDSIYRGGIPNADGVAYLASQGVKTFISLEFEEDDVAFEQQEVKKYGIKYLHRPMQYTDAPTDEQVNEILAQLQDVKNYPIYIHCRHGKDRTGLIVALFNVEVLGWTPKQAYDDMLKKGFAKFWWQLEQYYKRRTGMARAA